MAVAECIRAFMPRKHKMYSPYAWLFYLVAMLWIVEFVNLLFDHQFCRYGIFPRTPQGLVGIPFSPFLHAGVVHLFLNTGPLIVLGGLILMTGRAIFIRSTVFIILMGGLGLWLVGRPAYHVGASALIFGYFGFILAKGIFDRRMRSFFFAMVAIAAYGGLFWGLLPAASYVSWEGHACGFIAGILAAWIDRRKRR
jgi:membrane associated rhomboid family serine protease